MIMAGTLLLLLFAPTVSVVLLVVDRRCRKTQDKWSARSCAYE